MSDYIYDQYCEYLFRIGNSEIVFFIDDGIEIRGKYSYGMHNHRFNEIIYVLRGTCEIKEQNGKIILEKGDAVLIPAGTEHSIKADLNSYFMVVSFWIRKIENGVLPDAFDEFSRISENREIIPFKRLKCGTSFDKLLEYYYSNYKYKEQFMVNCFQEIILMILEKIGTEVKTSKAVTLESNDYRSYIIENYLNFNFKNSARLTDLANLLHLSTVQTQRLVKRLYKMPFREQIIQRRMDYAKNLISDTELTILQISAECGYTSVRSFAAAFKAASGLTPKQFRRKCERCSEKHIVKIT